MRALFVIFLSFLYMVYAEAPIEPEFSLDNQQLQEPPPLPQLYGIELPFDSYTMPPSDNTMIILPDAPMLMEICVITDNTARVYPSADELMKGCYRGDKGINHFVLQPYQYWKLLTMPNASLIPKAGVALYPSVVMNYIDSNGVVAGSIEVGVSAGFGYIAINGHLFEQDPTILSAIYKLVNNVYDESYIQ